MRIRANDLCILHRRRNCCGRESSRTRSNGKDATVWITIAPGVKRNKLDGRERRSPSAMRKLLGQKVQEQKFICAICDKPFTDVRDIVPDHREPKGLGGARRDDCPSNIQAAHSWCNLDKGSRRLQ
jgi:HNH endonuclease